MSERFAKVGDRYAPGDLRVEPARLRDVLFNGVDPVDVISLLPVEEDVAGTNSIRRSIRSVSLVSPGWEALV